MNTSRRFFLSAAPFAIAGALAACQSESKVAQPKFTADSCCAKAAADGKVCTHPCCVDAAKAGTVCTKCNKT
jgi:hypothetical protein